MTSDIHLTDNVRDQDRWKLLPWITKQAKKFEADYVVIAGDVTDQKDRHSAVLVNKVVKQLRKLAAVCHVIILKGNHDFIDEVNPFFGFVNAIENVTFIVKNTDVNLTVDGCDVKALFLPNTKRYQYVG